MEAVLMTSSSPSPSFTAYFSTRVLPFEFECNHISLQQHGATFTSQCSPRTNAFRGRLTVAAAKKKKTGSKMDRHSFVPKADEATGPFPEAVLLKKRTVKEDGRVMPEFADAEEEKLFDFLTLQLESNLNVEQMRHYEVVYLVHEDYINEVESVISKVQDFVREKKGRVWRLNNWGLRRLAYKIKKANNANYVLMNFELDAKCINDFKTMLDKDERVIRHLVIKRDEAITEDCPPPQEFHSLQADGVMDCDDDSFDLDYYDDEDDELELDISSQEEDVDDGNSRANVFLIDGHGDEAKSTQQIFNRTMAGKNRAF